MRSFLLHPPGIIVSDEPPGLFPYALDSHDRHARAFEPFIAAGFTDAEAWEVLFTDEDRIRITKSVYGNRPTKAPPLKKRRRGQGELFA